MVTIDCNTKRPKVTGSTNLRNEDSFDDSEVSERLEYLCAHNFEEIPEISIYNCEHAMPHVQNLFKNCCIGRLKRLNLDGGKGKPKMSPFFCKALCQFIEYTISLGTDPSTMVFTDRNYCLRISNFSLYTAQFNQILKAARRLINVEICNNRMLDRAPLRIPVYEMSHVSETSISKSTVPETGIDLMRLDVSNNKISHKQFKSLRNDIIRNKYVKSLRTLCFSGNFSEEKEQEHQKVLNVVNKNLKFR